MVLLVLTGKWIAKPSSSSRNSQRVKCAPTDGGSMYRLSATVIVVLAIGLSASTPLAQSVSTKVPQTTFDVMEKTIPELQDAMAAGMVTSRKLVEIYLARIAAYDKQG